MPNPTIETVVISTGNTLPVFHATSVQNFIPNGNCWNKVPDIEHTEDAKYVAEKVMKTIKEFPALFDKNLKESGDNISTILKQYLSKKENLTCYWSFLVSYTKSGKDITVLVTKTFHQEFRE